MIIGIDLGTTNSAVAYIDENGNPAIVPNREGERVTPSVIFFEDGTPVIGSTAKSIATSDPGNTVQFIKRHMGNSSYKFPLDTGDVFTPEELSAIILKRLKVDAEEALGCTVNDAVITVPAYFDDAQRKATQDAGKIAGMNVLKVINEPTAAALAYGLANRDKQQNIMVYDLGGGTFDVTIIQLNQDEIVVKATGGDRNLGGFDFDNKIFEFVEQKFEEEHGLDLYDDLNAVQDLREKAEACKKMLSSRKKSVITLSSQGKTVKVDITKDDFDAMLSPLLNRTTLIMKNVLMDAEMNWSDIDKILLVGGSTRVPAVSEVIEKMSGIQPSKDVNPDEVVALGAAVQGSLLEVKGSNSSGEEKPVHKTRVVDVNSHSLGMLIVNSQTNQMMNQIILKRNTPIPAERYDVFSTVRDGQQFIHVQLTEGEDEDPEFVKIIGESDIDLGEPKQEGYPVRFILSYDENGVIHVFGKDEHTGKHLGEMHIERKSNLSESVIEQKAEKLAGISVE
ncbi:Hsp70 family protein [Bacillus sp. PS06]|uniref:Hsp70 family protein n=1 Tax=Bacillus sp. PS06 TaxID=2764176 RepID=UPI00177ED5AA|nr:Hsp70 family protein [Bacillus sp. PS06]MBD8070712.1 Hsp70 family protein [Bacillus sp. PS06]